MHLYIFGANGQLGTALRRTTPASSSVTTFSREDWDMRGPIPWTREQRAQIFATPGVIINCAAHTDVEGEESPEDFAAGFRLNTVVPGLIAALGVECGLETIHISTDYVYAGYPPSEVKLSTSGAPAPAVAPINMYGLSKLWGEQNFLRNGGTSVVRTSWLYSGPENPESRDIANTFNRLYPKDLRVVSDQVGSPTNAFDLARALWEYAAQGPTEVKFDAHNEGETTWVDFAGEIYRFRSEHDTQSQDSQSPDSQSPDSGATAGTITPVSSAEYGAKARRPLYNVTPNRKMILPPWQESLHRALGAKL
ncbi:MAG: NAD(P)-dependent oxidoreductase [Corynebacterium sp.]|nr:NAD(P)-dependent oxidoreductase [Corynebacterium sp.]